MSPFVLSFVLLWQAYTENAMHWVNWEQMEFEHQPQHEDVWVVRIPDYPGEYGSPDPAVPGDVFWFGLDPWPFKEGTAHLGAFGISTPCIVDLFLRCLQSDQFAVNLDDGCRIEREEYQNAIRCATKLLELCDCLILDRSPAADIPKAFREFDESLKDSHIGLPYEVGRAGEIKLKKWKGPAPRFPGESGPMEPRSAEQEVVSKHMFIAQARKSLEMCNASIPKLWVLARLAKQATVCEPARRFLGHVSRCYLWGFDTECVILCRSALDAAFREAITDSDCDSLSKRIVAAEKKGLISGVIRRRAFDMKERGNKTVHYDPDTVRDVLGTIEGTLAVIMALSGRKS